MGIIGLREVSSVADFFGQLVIPHVTGNGNFFIMLAATLQAMATVGNCPMIDTDGAVEVPNKPGIGIEIDEDQLALEVNLAWEI